MGNANHEQDPPNDRFIWAKKDQNSDAFLALCDSLGTQFSLARTVCMFF